MWPEQACGTGNAGEGRVPLNRTSLQERPSELVPSRDRAQRPPGTDSRPSPAGLLQEACGTESRKAWEGGFQDTCWDAEGRDPSCSQQHRSQGMSFPPAAREVCPVTPLIHICHHGKKFPWSLANQPRMRVPATSPLTGGMGGKGTPFVARGLPASTVTLDAAFLPPVFKCDAPPVARASPVSSLPSPLEETVLPPRHRCCLLSPPPASGPWATPLTGLIGWAWLLLPCADGHGVAGPR